MAFSIMQCIMVMLSVSYAQCQLCSLSFMLSVIFKPLMLSISMLSIIMLSVIMLTVVVPQISHIQRLFTVWSQSSANLSFQDKTLAEFSTLDVVMLVRAMHFHS